MGFLPGTQLHSRHHRNPQPLSGFDGSRRIQTAIVVRQGNQVIPQQLGHSHQIVGGHVRIAAGRKAGMQMQVIPELHGVSPGNSRETATAMA